MSNNKHDDNEEEKEHYSNEQQTKHSISSSREQDTMIVDNMNVPSTTTTTTINGNSTTICANQHQHHDHHHQQQQQQQHPSSCAAAVMAAVRHNNHNNMNGRADDDDNEDKDNVNKDNVNDMQLLLTSKQQQENNNSNSSVVGHNNNNIVRTGSFSNNMMNNRRDLFGDCALIEIIHLHDCLRGALRALENDVNELASVIQRVGSGSSGSGGGNGSSGSGGSNACGSATATATAAANKNKNKNRTINDSSNNNSNSASSSSLLLMELSDLEGRVAGRFKVIWSVFRAHSSAEDEFIWPMLQSKTQGRCSKGCNSNSNKTATATTNDNTHYHNDYQHSHHNGHHHHHHHHHVPSALQEQQRIQHTTPASATVSVSVGAAATAAKSSSTTSNGGSRSRSSSNSDGNNNNHNNSNNGMIEQEEYEEDHADEERMFLEMDILLRSLRDSLLREQQQESAVTATTSSLTTTTNTTKSNSSSSSSSSSSAVDVAGKITALTKLLSTHLMKHLEKEETQCMPLVVKHLSKIEIHELVGNIMGKRSADTITAIMTMAVQSLDIIEREEMIKYMKQSMQNTFFDKWLLASGWGESTLSSSSSSSLTTASAVSSSGNNNNNEYHQNQEMIQAAIATDTTGSPVAVDAASTSSFTLDSDRKRPAQETLVVHKEEDEGNSFFDGKKIRNGSSPTEHQQHYLHPENTTIGTSLSDAAAGGGAGTASYASLHHEQEEDTSKTTPSMTSTSYGITSQAELERLIRAIATNPALTALQKNTTIQGLRDSVWKSNQREKERTMSERTAVVPVNQQPWIPAISASSNAVSSSTTTATTRPPLNVAYTSSSSSSIASASHLSNSHEASLLHAGGVPMTSMLASSQPRPPQRVGLPPALYYKKTPGGSTQLVWNSRTSTSGGVGRPNYHIDDVPLFSAAELAPTYHDGAAGAVFGCPHYARACKLRHPKSGRLYTCRLCCDQARELPNNSSIITRRVALGGPEVEEPLDRYAVTEVMCMQCNTLQPAEDRCMNSECESNNRPFARYFCRICHLYDDDGSRPIFHCPYCNTCRLGLGLGIDFRHCMRCNACVSLDDKEHHCIPQKLQGSCPICHDSLFQSTEPLRGLNCGHVMHMKCFTEYRRRGYTCPLCMRCMEDMRDHFALLDTAVRMQPMPASFLNTKSNIYCQDCAKTSQVQYHFVGQKCFHCGSYNTREMGRVSTAT